MQPGTGVPVKDGADAADAPSIPTAATTSAGQKVVPKTAAAPKTAAPKAAAHATSVAERTKSTTIAGKGKGRNGKTFADLAAARRARQARVKPAAGAGAR